jgi:hypothetical protein
MPPRDRPIGRADDLRLLATGSSLGSYLLLFLDRRYGAVRLPLIVSGLPYCPRCELRMVPLDLSSQRGRMDRLRTSFTALGDLAAKGCFKGGRFTRRASTFACAIERTVEILINRVVKHHVYHVSHLHVSCIMYPTLMAPRLEL